ncbi:MAG: dihydrofolate reductase family protein [Candidatus Kerfeldbacteria bacterium]|nr:dihydrofolate reductase family protein [Candidatus Kerfeldbacteria bacterium]
MKEKNRTLPKVPTGSSPRSSLPAGRQAAKADKPRYLAFVTASVDGRISLTSKTLPSWTSTEDWRFFQKSLAEVDAVVAGRNTYRAAATRLRKRNTYILSNRLATLRRRGTVTFVNPHRIDLAELLQSYKTVAILGGGMVYRTMLERNLLDEIFVTIEPLIFGRGKEMFVGGTRTIKLRLLSVRRLNRSGTLLLHYQVNR